MISSIVRRRGSAKRLLSALAVLCLGFAAGAMTPAEAAPAGGERKLCAAVRGNGGRVFVHFAALARAHETYGALDAMAGASSGSLVSFMTDAIYSNPLASTCGAEACSRDERAARLALLFKTVATANGVAAAAEGANAFFMPVLLSRKFDEAKIDEVLAKDPQAGVALFRATILSEPFAAVVNPAVLDTLDRAADKPAMVADLIKGVRGTISFALDSPLVFVRPGVVNFDVLTEFYGRIGDFYAMSGAGADRAGMEGFFQQCATPGRGKPWSEVANLPAGDKTCGALFSGLMGAHHSAALKQGPAQHLGKPTASALPMLVSVSYMGGRSADVIKQARVDYLAGKPISWTPDFADWRALYAGRDGDLDNLARNEKGYSDLKSQRVKVAKDMSWREILTRSGSEPGTQAAIDFRSEGFTAGGWVDGQPVQALRNIGCETVMLFETAPDQSYQSKVAELFGAKASDLAALFDTSSAKSSYSINFADADGVWCTRWNDASLTDMPGMEMMGWNATLEARSSKLAAASYAGIVRTRDSTVCTPPRKP